MAIAIQTLNNYVGTDDLGNATTIVAENMETACAVYAQQLEADPITMQCTKKNIRTVLPATYTTFRTEVYDPTGVAKDVCTATPETYTLLAGSKQVFTAIAGEGFKFVKWSIDGEDVAGDEGKKDVAMLTIPASETIVTIRAVFAVSI